MDFLFTRKCHLFLLFALRYVDLDFLVVWINNLSCLEIHHFAMIAIVLSFEILFFCCAKCGSIVFVGLIEHAIYLLVFGEFMPFRLELQILFIRHLL